MKIKGLNKLTEEQKELLFKVNKLHTESVGDKYKKDMEITKAWIEGNTVCAMLAGGDWFHYLDNGTWY